MGIRQAAVLLALWACAPLWAAPAAGDVHGLWRVDQARTEPLLDRGTARLDFGTDGHITGHTSCAPMSAPYTLTGADIHIGAVTTTPPPGAPRCGRLQLEQEDRILTALELAATARVRDDGLLELRDAEGRGVLRGTRFTAEDDTPMSDAVPPSTCDLCDTYKAHSDGSFRVLAPVFHDYGGVRRFAGPVSTVKCHEDNSLVKAALDEFGAGRVLVVDAGASLRRAVVGGNLAAAAAKNGWAGIVVDGCVRDSAELAECAVGIKALGLMPLPTEKRQTGQRDVDVQIQGVWVRPGEWLYADDDGVVVLAQPA